MTIPIGVSRWLLCVLLPLAACERGTSRPPIPDDTFVQVMVSLRRAAMAHPQDATAFNAAKQEILADAGVTDSVLYAYVNARGNDPERLSTVFAEIRDSLRARPDTVRQ